MLLPNLSTPSTDSSQGDLLRLEETIAQWRQLIASRVSLTFGDGLNDDVTDSQQVSLVGEVDYWEKLLEDLVFLHEQLNSESSMKLAEILRINSSKYTSYFDLLNKDVDAAIARASCLKNFLKPLKSWFEKLENLRDLSIDETLTVCVAMPRLLRLFWENICISLAETQSNSCSSMKSNPPLILLLKLIGKVQYALILGFSDILNCEDGGVFGLETAEVAVSISNCQKFSSTFIRHFEEEKQRLHETSRDNHVIDPWGFAVTDVLAALYESNHRLETLKQFFEIITQFSRLEKIEVGAIIQHGTESSKRLKEIHEEFVVLQGTWQRSGLHPLAVIFNSFLEAKYQPLGLVFLKTDEYIEQFSILMETISKWTREIAKIIDQSFNSSTSIINGLKIFDSFRHFASRPEIKSVILPGMVTSLSMFEKKLI
ncbi:hypothetical protein GEMRC1_005540 [Eukaryota sp. GEM-RC1]